MKKLIFSLSALAALLLAGSCQRENLEPVQQGGTVTYTVQVPGALATKAVGDNELIYEVYRETQVSDETAKPIYEGTTTFSGNSVDLPLEFVKNQKFVVLFWAQKEGSKVYDIKDLRKVSISKAQKLTSNNFDAEVFAGNDLVENCASKKGGNVELVRPIAQLNIATDSEGLSLGTTPVELNKSYVKVTGLSATYNVYKGYGSTETANAVYGMTDVPTGTITVGTESYNYVAMNYIGFMPQSDITVDVDFAIQTSEGNINHTVSNVPVKANYKTNIIGNLISATDNYNVTLGAWGTEETNLLVVDSATGLKDAIDNAKEGEEITLTGDIDLSELFPVTKAAAALPIVIAEGKSVVLNLNGYRITTPLVDGSTTNHTYAFENHGELTIKDTKGNGKIVARGNFNYGKMTLESGTINACDGNGGYGVRNYEGAEFVMKGGTVATIYEDGDIPGEGYDASPIRVDEGAKAVINGGIIDNVSNYTVAIDNYGETIVNAGTFTSVHTTLANSAVMTINGGSFTCNGLEGITAHALWAAEGTTTINGGTFDGKDNYNGFNVDASAGAVVNITGGKFLPVHSGSLYGEGTISVTGGEFFDDPAAFVVEGYPVIAPETEGGYYTIGQLVPVAKIGDQEYGSLRAAVAAAQEDETITLVKDIEQADGVIITDKKLTIDLNDKTFTVSEGANTNNRNFKINGSSDVTIKNGIMVAAGEYSSGAYGTVRTEGTANVTLTDVKLYNYRGNGLNVKALSGTTVTINDTEIYSQYGGGVEAAGGTVELTNVKVDQKGMYTAPYNSMAISVNGGGTATVNSGTYSTVCITAEEANNQGTSHGPWCAGVLNSGGTLIIKGGTFSNDNFGDNALATYARGLLLADTGANIQINGGTFNALKAIVDVTNNLGDASRNPSVTLDGGNFSADPRISGLYASHLISVAEGYAVVENNGTWNVVVDPAAKIGETEYATLQEAFNVGGNVTLLRNVTITETVVLAEGKAVVLDLNGKTLAAADMNVVKNNGGNLTIKNGTVTRTGDVVGYSVNNASGEIAVVNATIQRGLYTSGSKMTATNANISHEQSSRHAIYAWNCEVTINSGTFHNGNAGNATLMASGSSVVTINGGTFSIADGRSTLGWTSSMIDQNSTAQVVVKGGLFNGGFRINSADTRLTIEGGEFNTNNGSAFSDYSGTKVVKGGKFTDAGAQNWAKKYIAEGYEMNANGEVVAK